MAKFVSDISASRDDHLLPRKTGGLHVVSLGTAAAFSLVFWGLLYWLVAN